MAPDSGPPLSPTFEPGDGYGFELYVAELLRNMGWVAVVTPKGADSGVDIAATFDTEGKITRLVVQTKNHKQPVGFGAVQEIFSGMALHRAHVAWVVSTNGFTKKAKKGAKALGVRLLTIAELHAQATAHAEEMRILEARRTEERRAEQERAKELERAAPATERFVAEDGTFEERVAAIRARRHAEREKRRREQASWPGTCWNCARSLPQELTVASDGLVECPNCNKRALVR